MLSRPHIKTQIAKTPRPGSAHKAGGARHRTGSATPRTYPKTARAAHAWHLASQSYASAASAAFCAAGTCSALASAALMSLSATAARSTTPAMLTKPCSWPAHRRAQPQAQKAAEHVKLCIEQPSSSAGTCVISQTRCAWHHKCGPLSHERRHCHSFC